jgi:F-type H+-transporting ATPase subunit b
MIFLVDFSPIQPEIGLLFWSVLIFALVWIVIGRYAFKPIANALKDREANIEQALRAAEIAREEMVKMQAENEVLLAAAREERTKMLKEAKEIGERMIKDAEGKARQQASRLVSDARQEIEQQKNAAILELKNEAARLSLDIATKVLRRELSSPAEQEAYVKQLIDEVKLN